jgi:hypothetical protein
VTAVSLREEPSHHNGVERETLARWQRHTVKKDIHTANEEEQAKICRKLEEFIKKSDDYKSPLNYYPKGTKNPLPGRSSPSSAWRERRMDFVPEKPMPEADGAPVLHGWGA